MSSPGVHSTSDMSFSRVDSPLDMSSLMHSPIRSTLGDTLRGQSLPETSAFMENSTYKAAYENSELLRRRLMEKLHEAQMTIQKQSGKLSQLEAAQLEMKSFHSTQSSQGFGKLSDLDKAISNEQKRQVDDLRLSRVLTDKVESLEKQILSLKTDKEKIGIEYKKRQRALEETTASLRALQEEHSLVVKTKDQIEQELEDWKARVRKNKLLANETGGQLEEIERLRKENHELNESKIQLSLQSDKLTGKAIDLKIQLETLCNERDELKQEKRHLSSLVTPLQESVADLKSHLASVAADRDRYQQEKGDIEARLHDLTASNSKLAEVNVTMSNEVASLNKALQDEREKTKEIQVSRDKLHDELDFIKKSWNSTAESSVDTGISLTTDRQSVSSFLQTSDNRGDGSFHDDSLEPCHHGNCSDVKEENEQLKLMNDLLVHQLSQQTKLAELRSSESLQEELEKKKREMDKLHETVEGLESEKRDLLSTIIALKNKENIIPQLRQRISELENDRLELSSSLKSSRNKDEVIIRLQQRVIEVEREKKDLIVSVADAKSKDKELEELKQRLRTLEVENGDLSSSVNELSSRAALCEQLERRLSNGEREKEDMSSALRELRSKEQNVEKLIEAVQRLEKDKKILNDEINALKNKEQELLLAKQQLSVLENEIDELQSALTDSQNMNLQIPLLNETIDKLKVEKQELKSDYDKTVDRHGTEVSEMQLKMSRMEEEKGQLVLTMGKLHQQESVNNNLKQNITRLEKEEEDLRLQLGKAVKDKEIVEAKMGEKLKNIENEKKSLELQVENVEILQQKNSDLEEQMSNLVNQIEECKQYAAENLHLKEKCITDLKKKLASLENENRDLVFGLTDMKRKESQSDTLREKLINLEKEKRNMEKEWEKVSQLKEQRVSEMKKRLSDMEQEKIKITLALTTFQRKEMENMSLRETITVLEKEKEGLKLKVNKMVLNKEKYHSEMQQKIDQLEDEKNEQLSLALNSSQSKELENLQLQDTIASFEGEKRELEERCKSNMEKKEKVIAEMEQRLICVEEERGNLTELLGSLQSNVLDVSKLQEKVKMLENEKKDLCLQAARLESAETDITSLRAQVDQLEKEKSGLSEALIKSQNTELYSINLEHIISELEKEKNELFAALMSLQNNEVESATLQDEVVKLKEENAHLTSALSSAKEKNAETSELQKTLQEVKSANERYLEEIDALKKDKMEVSDLMDKLMKLQKENEVLMISLEKFKDNGVRRDSGHLSVPVITIDPCEDDPWSDIIRRESTGSIVRKPSDPEVEELRRHIKHLSDEVEGSKLTDKKQDAMLISLKEELEEERKEPKTQKLQQSLDDVSSELIHMRNELHKLLDVIQAKDHEIDDLQEQLRVVTSQQYERRLSDMKTGKDVPVDSSGNSGGVNNLEVDQVTVLERGDGVQHPPEPPKSKEHQKTADVSGLLKPDDDVKPKTVSSKSRKNSLSESLESPVRTSQGLRKHESCPSVNHERKRRTVTSKADVNSEIWADVKPSGKAEVDSDMKMDVKSERKPNVINSDKSADKNADINCNIVPTVSDEGNDLDELFGSRDSVSPLPNLSLKSLSRIPTRGGFPRRRPTLKDFRHSRVNSA